MVSINLILTFLLTAIGVTAGGRSTVHIYTKQYIEQHNLKLTTQLTTINTINN
jgi:hypothetical protein